MTSCRIEDLVEIGEKCTIGEGAVVESNVVLEPGTVVPAYARIPSGQRWGGNSAVFIENLDDVAKDHTKSHAEAVGAQAQEHILEFLPVENTNLHLEALESEGVKAKQG